LDEFENIVWINFLINFHSFIFWNEVLRNSKDMKRKDNNWRNKDFFRKKKVKKFFGNDFRFFENWKYFSRRFSVQKYFDKKSILKKVPKTIFSKICENQTGEILQRKIFAS